MFDNLPFVVKDEKTIESFLKRGILKIVNECVDYCEESGEQYTSKVTYRYYNLNFTLKYRAKDVFEELKCRGSFHYLFNKGKHNANNLNFVTATNHLLNFADTFDIDSYKLRLLPPEFAQNMIIPFDVTEVVQNTFCEERKEFSFNPPHVKTSKISGAPSHDNRLKLYSKSHDCPKFADDNLLRAEIQFKKTRWLIKEGIDSIGKLLELNSWYKIRDKHINDFDKLVIYDYTIVPPKNLKIRAKLSQYQTERFWRKLIQDCNSGKCHYTKYNETVQDLNNLSKKYGSNLKHEILEIIRKQWDWFFLSSKKSKYAPVLKTKHAPFIACTQTEPIIKKCSVTGIELNHEKGNPNYIRTATLKYLKNHDKEKFELLALTFIPKTGKRPKFEKNMISQISHNIRNAYYNPIKYKQSGYKEKQYKNQLTFDYEHNT